MLWANGFDTHWPTAPSGEVGRHRRQRRRRRVVQTDPKNSHALTVKTALCLSVTLVHFRVEYNNI